jgi:hypothetical protein
MNWRGCANCAHIFPLPASALIDDKPADVAGVSKDHVRVTTGSAADPFIVPNGAEILTGAAGSFDVYTDPSPATISSPSTFGSGGTAFASSGSGDNVGITPPAADNFFVPHGYVSDSALSDTAIYDSATFASLGVTPGTYVWTWGTGADQSFTLEIGQTPLPAALPLFATGVGGLGLLGWRRKRKAQTVA